MWTAAASGVPIPGGVLTSLTRSLAKTWFVVFVSFSVVIAGATEAGVLASVMPVFGCAPGSFAGALDGVLDSVLCSVSCVGLTITPSLS